MTAFLEWNKPKRFFEPECVLEYFPSELYFDRGILLVCTGAGWVGAKPAGSMGLSMGHCDGAVMLADGTDFCYGIYLFYLFLVALTVALTVRMPS